MAQWWESLTLFQQIMFCIAAPSSLIIIVQLVFMLIGFGGGDTFETAEDLDFNVGEMSSDTLNNEGFLSLGGIKVLTLRGILAFLSVASWLALALSYSMNEWIASLIGILGGGIVAFLIALAFHYAMKLQSQGNINYNKAVGSIGTVYMRIPAERTGKGKINMTLQERYVEIDAVTDSEEMIDRGIPVKVLGIVDDITVVVEKLKVKKEEV